MLANDPRSMIARICSVRVRSCDSISGTVSGIGSRTSAGSTPDESLDAAGAGAPAAAPGLFTGAVAAGTALVIVGVAVAPGGGSFEYVTNVKSNRLCGPSALNCTCAYIAAGNGSLPIAACRERPLRTSGTDF